jgi:hypothetical protein
LVYGEEEIQLATGKMDMTDRVPLKTRFQTNHSLLFTLNDACLEEKQQIPIS